MARTTLETLLTYLYYSHTFIFVLEKLPFVTENELQSARIKSWILELHGHLNNTEIIQLKPIHSIVYLVVYSEPKVLSF